MRTRSDGMGEPSLSSELAADGWLAEVTQGRGGALLQPSGREAEAQPKLNAFPSAAQASEQGFSFRRSWMLLLQVMNYLNNSSAAAAGVMLVDYR